MTATALAAGALALLPGAASAESGNLTYSCTYGDLVSGPVQTTVTIDTDAPDTTPVGTPLQVLTTTALTVPDSVHNAISAKGATAVQLVATDPDGVTVDYDFGGTSTPVRTHPVFHFADWVFTGTSGGAYSMNPGPRIPGTYVVHADAIDLDLDVTVGAATTTYPVSCTVPSGQLVDQILVTDATSTGLSLSSSTATYGGTAPVATATVTRAGTPTSAWPALGGRVQFSDGDTVLGTAPVTSSGTATYTLSGLGSGHHSITAAYVPGTGDAYQASTSPAGALTVSTPTTTKVTTPATADLGTAASASIAVAAADGSTPTGSVQVSVDGGTPTSASLSGGRATVALPTGKPGTHAVTATYGGEDVFLTSSGTASYHVGSPTSTEVKLDSSSWSYPDAAPGATATVTAPGSDATWPPIEGSVQFYDGTTKVGTADVDSDGHASLAHLPALALGDHQITAEYTPTGDAPYALSTSDPQSLHVVTRTRTTLSAPASVAIDTSAKATATVTSSEGSIPTGTVTFTVNGASTAVPLSNGTASFTLPTGAAGRRDVTATYDGDGGDYLASDPVSASYVVGAAATRTTVSLNHSSAAYGLRTTLKASVSSSKGKPAGTVRFKVGSHGYTATVRNGTGSYTLPKLAPGSYKVSATFVPSNSATFTGSATTATPTLRITKDATRTTTSLGGVRLHQRPTEAIAVHSTHGALVTGKVRVQLKRYGTVTQTRTVTLANGRATATFWKIGRAGTWRIVTTYVGNGSFTRSSVTKTVVVRKPAAHTRAAKH